MKKHETSSQIRKGRPKKVGWGPERSVNYKIPLAGKEK